MYTYTAVNVPGQEIMLILSQPITVVECFGKSGAHNGKTASTF